MAKKLTKRQRGYFMRCIENIPMDEIFVLRADGSCSAFDTRKRKASWEAFRVRQDRAYMAIYC